MRLACFSTFLLIVSFFLCSPLQHQTKNLCSGAGFDQFLAWSMSMVFKGFVPVVWLGRFHESDFGRVSH